MVLRSQCPFHVAPSLLPSQNFEVEADDLVTISELGRGAYGVVEKVRHAQSGTIMAVKVRPACSPGHALLGWASSSPVQVLLALMKVSWQLLWVLGWTLCLQGKSSVLNPAELCAWDQDTGTAGGLGQAVKGDRGI